MKQLVARPDTVEIALKAAKLARSAKHINAIEHVKKTGTPCLKVLKPYQWRSEHTLDFE